MVKQMNTSLAAESENIKEMSLVDELETVLESLRGTFLEGDVCIVENTLYCRHDTDDSDSEEQWDNYLDVQDQLKDIGYMLDDPQVEHDCISGDLIKYKES